MIQPFRVRRSLLFVPAVRPDRYPKALATGADAICVDLEDGVALGAKDEARREAMALFAKREPSRAEVILRINDPATDIGRHDLQTLGTSGIRPDALMLPKVAGPEVVAEVEAALAPALPDLPLIVMIESARGLARAEAIATATPNISAVFFGAVDFSADVGCAVDWEALLYARSRVVLAAALAGVSALDSPFMDVAALDALAEECRAARRVGFTGKAAIHPTQVAVIHQTLSPSAEEVAWARKIIAAYDANEGGVLLVDGKLVERPVITAARHTLQMAAVAEAPTTGEGTES